MTTTHEVMPLTGTVSHTATTADELISHRLQAPGYREWRAQVQATGGCAAPIHLSGSSQILDRDGAVLLERAGTVLAPCGNRRAAVCPACSDRYAADAYHLLRAGLAGDDQKGVPTTVVEHPRSFLTLTAPSFGPVHTRTLTRRGHVIPCRCGDRHHPTDPRLGAAVDPDTYDYTGAVLWQAHAGQLWARFTIALDAPSASAPRRPGPRLPRPTPGCPTPRSPSTNAAGSCTSTPSSASTDPTDPPTHHRPRSPSPRSATPSPARLAPPCSPPPARTAHHWWSPGARSSTSAPSPRLSPRSSRTAEASSPTRPSPATSPSTPPNPPAPDSGEGPDRPIRDGEHIAYLDVSPHHRGIIAGKRQRENRGGFESESDAWTAAMASKQRQGGGRHVAIGSGTPTRGSPCRSTGTARPATTATPRSWSPGSSAAASTTHRRPADPVVTDLVTTHAKRPPE